MRFHSTVFLILSLVFVSSSQASENTKAKKDNKSCQDIQVLLKAAQETITDAMASDTNDSVSDYLVLGGDPAVDKLNDAGNDLWKVPVVVDGEGCYGDVDITVKAGTCTLVGKPSFTGVSCTDN